MKNIIFENVGKSYGKNEIVKSLDFEVKDGERLILLGPSGCGKSTTLRMIAGLEDITKGNLHMNGKVVNEIPSGKRNVSMVFQNYALFPHMTVEDNITYGLKVQKLSKNEIDKRLLEVLDMLDLKGYEKRKPKDLSGGQRQRVALARATVKRSDYFLLDEPLSNLDAQLRLRARKELVKIHELYNQTFVYVTHDQIEAMTVGHRIALMNKGKLQMLDTPSNVYNRPTNVFTAKFIGSPSMNIAEVKYNSGKLHIGGQAIELPDIWKEKVATSGSQHFYFGIRPECIHLSTEKKSDSIIAIVKYVEDYGNKYGVYFDFGGIEFISVCDSFVPAPGSTVYFNPDFEKIHLFDYESEESIGYPSALEKENNNEYINQYKHVSSM